jgi:hypothetical protein
MNDRQYHGPKIRIGCRMRELADIVSAMPGCSKSDALRAAGLPTHGLGSGRALDRAIAAELIIVEYERVNLCHLFATQRDRKRWHLRRELLQPGTPAGVSPRSGPRSAPWTPHEHQPGRTQSSASRGPALTGPRQPPPWSGPSKSRSPSAPAKASGRERRRCTSGGRTAISPGGHRNAR